MRDMVGHLEIMDLDKTTLFRRRLHSIVAIINNQQS